eukprot:SAG22_NODE_2235_length_2807_cov_1.610188_2_plen_86_part_00
MTPSGPGVSAERFFEREAAGGFGATNVRNFADAPAEVRAVIDPFWTPATDAEERAAGLVHTLPAPPPVVADAAAPALAPAPAAKL